MKKRKIFSALLILVLTITALVGCGSETASTDSTGSEATSSIEDVSTNTSVENSTEPQVEEPTPTETPTPTDEPVSTEPQVHEHSYTESITKESTCTEQGTKTFTCLCDDVFTEEIPATGHQYGDYLPNDDATYTANGTKTAICTACGSKDTVADVGSKLTYTFTDLTATKYAKSSVNVRDLPSTDGNKLGSLTERDSVAVTGQCKETNWYRINYNGGVAYVSNSYLVDTKPVEPTEPKVEEPTPEPTEPTKPVGPNPETYGWTLGSDGIYRYKTNNICGLEWVGKTIAEYVAAGNTICFSTPDGGMVAGLSSAYDNYIIGSNLTVSNWNLYGLGPVTIQLPF